MILPVYCHTPMVFHLHLVSQSTDITKSSVQPVDTAYVLSVTSSVYYKSREENGLSLPEKMVCQLSLDEL